MNRAVITGIGTVHPFGTGWNSLWDNIIIGNSATGSIERFDTSGLSCKTASEVKDFDVNLYTFAKKVRKNDRCTQFAAASVELALADAKLDIEREDRRNIGVIMGNSCGGAEILETQMNAFLLKGEKVIHPMAIPHIMASDPAATCARLYGLEGPNITISTACSSGLNAIGMAWQMVRSGVCQVMIAGGSEAPVVPHLVAAFGSLGVLAGPVDGEILCMPFDKRRSGFVLGEGSGLLVIESMQHAVIRGAEIYAEISGFVTTCDVTHPVIPDSTGKSAARTIKCALEEANISMDQVDYIHAHGTGTVANDISEAKAIGLAFENFAAKPFISSSKGSIGHLLGAAGSIATIVTSITIKKGIIPPTANLEELDPECDLNFIRGGYAKSRVNCALVNSFGFGGNNACLVLKGIS